MITPKLLREIAYDLENRKITALEAQQHLITSFEPQVRVLSQSERETIKKAIERMHKGYSGSVVTVEQIQEPYRIIEK